MSLRSAMYIFLVYNAKEESMHNRKLMVAAALAALGFAYTAFAQPGGGLPGATDVLRAMLAELRALNVAVAGNRGCCPLVENAEQREGLVVDPVSGTEHTLVSIVGAGKFVSARMTKQGGASGLTFFSLELDGKNIENRSFVALKNFGLTQHNPYGVAIFTSGAGLDDVTIGFPTPLVFKESLVLKAIVNEPGVVQIIGTVMAGN